MGCEEWVFVWCPEAHTIILDGKNVYVGESFSENRQGVKCRIVPALRGT